MGFNGDIQKDLMKNMDKFVSSFFESAEEEWIATSTKIIEQTPIGIPNSERSDGSKQGNTRYNWQIGRNTNSRVLTGAGKKGESYARSKIQDKLRGNKELYLFNNAPNIKVLEFGGFPVTIRMGPVY